MQHTNGKNQITTKTGAAGEADQDEEDLARDEECAEDQACAEAVEDDGRAGTVAGTMAGGGTVGGTAATGGVTAWAWA
jgi:hypothetical protein